MRNRYRRPGLGAPLAAATSAIDPVKGFQVAAKQRVPVTALLRIDERFGLEEQALPQQLPRLRLAEIPVAPGIPAHPIVAVRGDGPVEDGSDGVVRYESAHIDGVESELIVRSGHSVQANPQTVLEVRRILLLHAEEACRERAIGCTEPAVPIGESLTR